MKRFIFVVVFLGVIGTISYSHFSAQNITGSSSDTSSETSLDTSASSLTLYQEYFVLQSQRDAASKSLHKRQTAAWSEQKTVKNQLASNSSDIELHRRLIRAQNEWEQSEADWYSAIKPLEDRMDALRAELRNRGEPPPR